MSDDLAPYVLQLREIKANVHLWIESKYAGRDAELRAQLEKDAYRTIYDRTVRFIDDNLPADQKGKLQTMLKFGSPPQVFKVAAAIPDFNDRLAQEMPGWKRSLGY